MLSVLPATVFVRLSVGSRQFELLLFLVFLCLFLNYFCSDSASFCSPSLATACPSLPLSVSLHLPPPLPPFFSPLPSWQRCQSGQADRGKHGAGQSRGRCTGCRIDYVYVGVLKCPLSLSVCVICLRFSHRQTASKASPL